MESTRFKGVRLLLRSLDIAGFKSFARPARLEFPSGITALVGPNGSGKSNIVDALRWCLGEQNPRDLRAGRGEDVIYAGPRRALGAADVSLTFESSDLGESSWSELEISRRLYRSGGGEYLINRQRSRLRDVVGVLADLGIDASRQVVVTQGMTDALLAATPLERRMLLEQAAGLSAYRERRDDARQKLATTRQNLATMDVVLAELEPRLRMLRRQARAVEERDEAIARLESRLRDWYAARWWELSASVQAASRKVTESAIRREAAATELGKIEEQAERSLERERTWQRELEMAIAAMHTSERERDAIEHEIARLEHERSERERALAAATEKLERVAAARIERERRLAEARESRQALEERRRALEVRLGELEAGRLEISEKLDGQDRTATARRAEHEEVRLRLDAVSTQLEGLSHRRDQLEAEDRQLDNRLQGAEERVTELQAKQVSLRLEAQRLLAESRGHLEQRQELDRQLARARQRESRLRGVRRRLQERLAHAKQTQAAVERRRAALRTDVGAGLLSDLRVAPGWETAVAAALGSWALAGSRSVRLHHADRGPFLAWRSTLVNGKGLLWADEVADGMPEGVWNPLISTILVETLSQAEGVWKQVLDTPGTRVGWPDLQIVTRDGHRWNALGVRLESADHRAAEFLSARHNAGVLQRQLGIWSRRLAVIDSSLEQLASEANRLAREGEEKARIASESGGRLGRLEREIDQVERDQLATTYDRGRWQDRRRATLAEIEEIASRLTELGDREAVSREEIASVCSAWESAQIEAEKTRDRLRDVAAEWEAVRAELETARGKEGTHLDMILLTEEDLERHRADGEMLIHEQGAIQSGIDDIEARVRDRRVSLEELNRIVDEQRRGVERIRSGRPDTSDRSELRELRHQLSEQVGRHERGLAVVSRLEEERERLSTEIVQELGTEPDRLPVTVEDIPAEAEIRRLRARAGQYADADAGVIDEYRELTERQQHLKVNADDLRETAEALDETMRIADRQMQSRFDEAFAAVSDEFSRVFRVMLRGGEARLEQTGEDGGVDIRAQLPGRRARSSAAFSGGERALVATSLLFGVLRIRPAPFCVLDEVDAALDENNVDRYLSVLRDLSRQTQMIVVTHNRATMAAADVLYGLTMDDEGVSSLLSLRLDQFAAV